MLGDRLVAVSPAIVEHYTRNTWIASFGKEILNEVEVTL